MATSKDTTSDLIEAIKNVRSKMVSLKQDSENKHGGYNYVSIDTYYEKVSKVATEVGVIWRTRELTFDLVPNQGKMKDRTYVQSKFAFDVYYGSSSIEDYMSVTVFSPYDGPQTTGQLFSYADKVFMRVAFCVSTGEKDADDIKQEPMNIKATKADPLLDDLPATPKTNGVVPHDPLTGELDDPGVHETLELSIEQTTVAPTFDEGLPLMDPQKIAGIKAVQTIKEIFNTFLPAVKTKTKLTDWYAVNLAAIEKADKVIPGTKKEISAMFRVHLNNLESK